MQRRIAKADFFDAACRGAQRPPRPDQIRRLHYATGPLSASGKPAATNVTRCATAAMR